MQPAPSPPSPSPGLACAPMAPLPGTSPVSSRDVRQWPGAQLSSRPRMDSRGQRVPTELPRRPLTCRLPRTRLLDWTSHGHPLLSLGQPVAETDAQGSERTCSGHPAGAGPPEPALPLHCLPGDAAPWRVARMMTPTPAKVHPGTQRRPRLKIVRWKLAVGASKIWEFKNFDEQRTTSLDVPRPGSWLVGLGGKPKPKRETGLRLLRGTGRKDPKRTRDPDGVKKMGMEATEPGESRTSNHPGPRPPAIPPCRV